MSSKKQPQVYLDETFGPRVGQKRPLPPEPAEQQPLTRNGRKKRKKRQKKRLLQQLEGEGNGDSNALVVPAKKRKVEEAAAEAAEPAVPRKKLSKKERKKLERKVQLAQKRAKREEVLAELQKYQATPRELSVLASIKEVHTQRAIKKQPSTFAQVVNKGKGVFHGVKKWKLGKKKKKKKKNKKTQDVPTEVKEEPKQKKTFNPFLDPAEISSCEETDAEEVEEQEEGKMESEKESVFRPAVCWTEEAADPCSSEQNGPDTAKPEVESKTAEEPTAEKKKKKKKKKKQPVPESQSQPIDPDLCCEKETVVEEDMEEESQMYMNGGEQGIPEEKMTLEETAQKAKMKKAKKQKDANASEENMTLEETAQKAKKKRAKKQKATEASEEEMTLEEPAQKAKKKKAKKQKATEASESKTCDKPVESLAAPAKSQCEGGSDAGSSEKPADGAGSSEKPADSAGSSEKPADSAGSSEKPGDGAGSSEKPGDGAGSSEKPGDGAGSSEKPGDGAAKTASVAAAGPQPEQSQRTVVLVERKPKIQDARLKLPILRVEQEVMEAINDNPVVIIAGETGSGKTTQVPQFLYEAGYAHGKGIIAVTEPRRVAAVSMAQRVAQELNVSPRVVSYQIRSEGTVTEDTKIKFMTDGVLLRELQTDFLLTKYSCVVLDEAHERNVNTDILIGLLSIAIILRRKKRNPLKLIIMSATLRVDDFSKMFKVRPPVVQVEGRQFPVDLHWMKQTPRDYLKAAYKKVCQIHNDTPHNGGILVFVTGRQEVHTLCHWLRKTFTSVPEEGATKPEKRRRRKKKRKEEEEEEEAAEIPTVDLDSYSNEPLRDEVEEGEEERMEREEEEQIERELDEALGQRNDSIFDLLAGDDRDDDDGFTPLGEVYRGHPLWVLPLYSLLPAEQQSKVFQPPPEGFRLCVVATNIAETSLTIPNIRYVVDTGKTKTRLYDKVTGVSTFHVTWVSKASADQRKGRAGRVSAGKCYRLYSSAIFNDKFRDFTPPEILQRPIEDVVLLMKNWNIVNVKTFPLPTPPEPEQIEAAERALTMLEALEPEQKPGEGAKLTKIGRLMARFPVAPRYAKMLALSNQKGLLPYLIALVSALSVDQVFIEDFPAPTTEEESEALKKKKHELKLLKRQLAGQDEQRLLGDMMVLLSAVLAVEREPGPETLEKYSLRPKAIAEIKKLRRQLTNIVSTMFPDANACIDPELQPPTQSQARMMRQCMLSGLGSQVARRWLYPPVEKNAPNWKTKHAYQCMDLAQPVYIHQSSVLHHQKIHYVVYQDIIENESGTMFMRGVAAVDMEWLPVYAPKHCIMSSPLDDPPPDYNAATDEIVCHMTGTFGRGGWSLGPMQLPYPNHRDKLRWFAVFFLEGSVEPALAKYGPSLLSRPDTMVRPWAHLQRRTTVLLHAITQRVVFTRQRLREVWEKEPDYLLYEYLEWLPRALHAEVEALWPPSKQDC